MEEEECMMVSLRLFACPQSNYLLHRCECSVKSATHTNAVCAWCVCVCENGEKGPHVFGTVWCHGGPCIELMKQKQTFGGRIENSYGCPASALALQLQWPDFQLPALGLSTFSDTLEGCPSSCIWKCCGGDAPYPRSLTQCLVRTGV